MESSGENLFQVKKERSYISCLVNGCSYGFKHLGLLLRYIWPSLALAIVLPIPFLFFFAAQTDAVLRKWIELGYLPNVTMKAMRRDIEKCANRSVIAVLLSFLMFILAAVGVTSLVLPIILGWEYLWSILIFVAVIILFLEMEVVVMQVRFSDLPIKECFGSGFRIAWRNLGKVFAFDFLLYFLSIIIILPGSIPYIILSSAGLQAYRGWQIGDALDLPVLFPLYVFLSAYILMAVTLLTFLVGSFADCLMWGSLVNEVPAETEADR